MWVLFLVLVSVEEPLVKNFNSELECKVALEQVQEKLKNYKDEIEDAYCEQIELKTQEIAM
jgi:hypothetical protein